MPGSAGNSVRRDRRPPLRKRKAQQDLPGAAPRRRRAPSTRRAPRRFALLQAILRLGRSVALAVPPQVPTQWVPPVQPGEPERPSHRHRHRRRKRPGTRRELRPRSTPPRASPCVRGASFRRPSPSRRSQFRQSFRHTGLGAVVARFVVDVSRHFGRAVLLFDPTRRIVVRVLISVAVPECGGSPVMRITEMRGNVSAGSPPHVLERPRRARR